MFSQKTYDRGDAIAISWHIDDVQSLDNTITDNQAREILARLDNNHDAVMEGMWDLIHWYVNEYKEEQHEI